MAKTDVTLSLSPQYLAFIIAIIAGVLLFATYLSSIKNSAHESLISVSASGSVSATPSQGTIYLFLNATGNTSAEAVSNLSTITVRINSTLLPLLKGNASAIKTQSYSVYPITNCNATYYPMYPTTTVYCPSPQRLYVATEYLLVTLQDVSNIDKAVVGLSAINGTSVSNVAARLSPRQQMNMSQQALTLALDNATMQAQALSGGRQLSIENITVQNGYVYYPLAAASIGSATNQTFYTGTATVTKSIFVVFRMH